MSLKPAIMSETQLKRAFQSVRCAAVCCVLKAVSFVLEIRTQGQAVRLAVSGPWANGCFFLSFPPPPPHPRIYLNPTGPLGSQMYPVPHMDSAEVWTHVTLFQSRQVIVLTRNVSSWDNMHGVTLAFVLHRVVTDGGGGGGRNVDA
jgi:hypothetical protein